MAAGHFKRPSKKSEMLEVRVSYEQKSALYAHCRETGQSASALVRDLISRHLSRSSWRTVFNRERTHAMISIFSKRPRAALASAVGGAALMSLAVAAPSGAQDARAAFEAMDANNDSMVSTSEFVASVREGGLIWNPRAVSDAPRRQVGVSELEGHTRSEFARYDRNRDGRMTYAEFSGRYVALMHASFVALDRDADSADELAVALGGIGYDEASVERNARPRVVMAQELIAEFDGNGDGMLSFAEFSAS